MKAWNRTLAGVAPVALMLSLAGGVSAEEPAGIGVQLNKLETDGDDCRAHLVLENGMDQSLESFQLDLVVFDDDGIIQLRTAVEMAPLQAGDTSVRAFRMADTACGDVGRVLLNEVTACEGPDGAIEHCGERVEVESLADQPFIR